MRTPTPTPTPALETYELRSGRYTPEAVQAWNDPAWVALVEDLELHADVEAGHQNAGHAGWAFQCPECSGRFRNAAPPTAAVVNELSMRRGEVVDIHTPLAELLPR